MANVPVSKSSSPLGKLGVGPQLVGVGALLFVITRIIKWLPLGWIDGPINGLLWIAILGCVAAGAGITYFSSKKSSQ